MKVLAGKVALVAGATGLLDTCLLGSGITGNSLFGLCSNL